jgi:enoyl-[acyl-carrier-protein] reductase (NADH)
MLSGRSIVHGCGDRVAHSDNVALSDFVVAFLASDEARLMTGAVVMVDAGLTAI